MKAEIDRVSALADKGDVPAARCLAQMKWYGMGMPRDSDGAEQILNKIADDGNEPASVDLQMARILSAGPDKFDPTQLKPIEHAALNGYGGAAGSLGSLYFYGFGAKLPRDMPAAARWFGLAAKRGNAFGDAAMASMYMHGWGVKRAQTKTVALLAKAATFSDPIGCITGYFLLLNQIVDANLRYPQGVMDGLEQGSVWIHFQYKDGKAEGASVERSSGYHDIDAAALSAVQISALPVLPKSFAGGEIPLTIPMSISIYGADPSFWQGFKGRIRHAIYTAVVLPKHALLYGTSGTGIARVGFDYLDGKITDLRLIASSNDKDVDDAALEAVKQASYPSTPKEYRGKKVHMLVPVNLRGDLGLADKNGNPVQDGLAQYLQTPVAVSRSSPAPAAATSGAPSAVTTH